MPRHTYTVHITFEADTDAQARLVVEGLEAIMVGIPQGDIHLTDADDWAEHLGDGRCARCGEKVERERLGIGRRVHHRCSILGLVGDLSGQPYEIVDTH